jgi:hypothetical protein
MKMNKMNLSLDNLIFIFKKTLIVHQYTVIQISKDVLR